MTQQPTGARHAQLVLQLPVLDCQECRRAARTVLEDLEGVSLVDVGRDSGAIAVTYDTSLIDEADIRRAAEQPSSPNP